MIIKKFMAKDSRSAMTQIRNEFGPDAILLSSKSVGDHFEMIAAPDYDDKDIEREIELQRAEVERKALKQQLEKQELEKQELEKEKQAQRERELAKLHEQDQQTLKVLRAEMADMRRLIEAQLKFDKAAGLSDEGPEYQPVIQPANKQPNPDRKIGRKPEMHIDQYLADIGLSRRLRESLRRRLQGINKIEMASSKTMQILSSAVREMNVGQLPDRGLAAFIGGEGAGKTTALIKLAQKHRKQHGVEGIGLILFGHKASLKKGNDNVLIKYSNSLDVRCLYAETPRQLLSAVKSLSKKSLVLIDCASQDKPTPALTKALTVLAGKDSRLRTFLTLAADKDRVNQEASINAYSELAAGLIVSKVRSARHLGALVELLIRKKMPLAYISETPKMDANISQGNSEKLIRMALDLGKLPAQSQAREHAEIAETRTNRQGFVNGSENRALAI